MSDLSSVELALLSYLGVNGRAFSHLGTLKDPRDLIEVSSLRSKRRMTDTELTAKRQAGEIYRAQLAEFQKQGGVIIGLEGERDLGGLTRASPPPLCAYVRGNAELIARNRKVAIVGTRNASLKGLLRAGEIAGKLATQGVIVVSGGAIGIDMAAHQGAVSQGSETLVVLGDPLKSGSDERPERLKSLKTNLVSTLTLFGPWVRPSRALYVARNQFVAALSDAVIIVEGRLGSGTLHTASYAHKLGIPVWAIPGDPNDEMAEASNWLLERGLARALVHIDYFMSCLTGIETLPQKQEVRQSKSQNETPAANRAVLSENQNQLLRLLMQNEGRMTVDELAEKCDTAVNALQQELFMMELLGVLKKQGSEFVIL